MRRLVFSMRNTAPARLISAIAHVGLGADLDRCGFAPARAPPLLALARRAELGRRVVGVAVGGIDGWTSRVGWTTAAEAIAEQIVGALEIAVDDQRLVRIADSRC